MYYISYFINFNDNRILDIQSIFGTTKIIGEIQGQKQKKKLGSEVKELGLTKREM